MKTNYSIGAKLKLAELRFMLKYNMIKDYSDFKEVPLGSGKISFKVVPNAPIKRLEFKDYVFSLESVPLTNPNPTPLFGILFESDGDFK